MRETNAQNRPRAARPPLPHPTFLPSPAIACANGGFHRENFQPQSMRDEVLYLHGLWNQGPPATANYYPNPSHNPIFFHFPNFCAYRRPTLSHLRPRPPLGFSKDRRHHRRRKKAVVSEKEWPLDPTSVPNQPSTIGWPEPPPRPAPRLPSAEELASALAARAQNNGAEACKRFFSKKDIEGDYEEGGSAGCLDDDDPVGEEEEEEEAEKRAFAFFMEIFTNHGEMRRYYEANREKGEFWCLVCAGIGAKKGKTYGDCTGLVQHCSNVAKTGRIAAHRALAKVLCRVVGWNFDRLPMFVLDIEETLGQKLAREASLKQEEPQETEQIHNEAVE